MSIKPLSTKRAVAWLNANPDHRIACTACGASYSWRSLYFVQRHFSATHGAAGWIRV